MDIIRLLPDSVANQIAAGEVIQRPASVVKELVENAVDAGATRIEVNIVDAGRTSIQVVDDGCGMSETDARLAFERHATSKIRQADDLFTLTTLGFRGEALPSIASVAQVELTTRTAEADLGTTLRIDGSRVVDQQPTACAPGSNFLVRNLFFNVPARRKFLKTDQTELTNITAEVERIVLIHPEIYFILTHNGTTLLNLPPATSKQRIAAVFGQRLADKLLPVEVQTPLVGITGFVGTPESARKRGAQQFFFVGGRYMRHPYFHRAVQEAFAALIAPDTSVPYFIAFDVDPSAIDVNIHPTKTEIKFENEQAIWQILLAALRESLGRFNAVPTIDFDTEGRPADIPVFNPTSPTSLNMPKAPAVAVDTSYNPFGLTKNLTPDTSSKGEGSSYFSESGKPVVSGQANTPLSLWRGGGGEVVAGEVAALRPLQLLGRYIATPSADGLTLVEQHRAHTRVLYDRYISQMADAAMPSQRLLFPDVVDLAPADVPIMPELMPELHRLGIDVSLLGPNVVSITGMPTGLEGIDPARLLGDLIAAARQTTANHAGDTLRSRLALTMANSAAIPVGQVLSDIEMEDLLTQLYASTAPAITPDGKTILSTITAEQIHHLF